MDHISPEYATLIQKFDRALANVSIYSKLSKRQRQILRQADKQNQEVVQLYRQGKYAQAISLAENSRAVKKKLLDYEHPSTALSINDLAQLYHSMGDYARAKLLYEQALRIKRTVLATTTPTPPRPSTTLVACTCPSESTLVPSPSTKRHCVYSVKSSATSVLVDLMELGVKKVIAFVVPGAPGPLARE